MLEWRSTVGLLAELADVPVSDTGAARHEGSIGFGRGA